MLISHGLQHIWSWGFLFAKLVTSAAHPFPLQRARQLTGTVRLPLEDQTLHLLANTWQGGCWPRAVAWLGHQGRVRWKECSRNNVNTRQQSPASVFHRENGRKHEMWESETSFSASKQNGRNDDYDQPACLSLPLFIGAPWVFLQRLDLEHSVILICWQTIVINQSQSCQILLWELQRQPPRLHEETSSSWTAELSIRTLSTRTRLPFQTSVSSAIGAPWTCRKSCVLSSSGLVRVVQCVYSSASPLSLNNLKIEFYPRHRACQMFLININPSLIAST